nr:hypothetical protein [Candidatus Njordarchaeum guaymaensis]
MGDTREADERESLGKEKHLPPASGKKGKVEIQIDAISTPKGDVPTVDTVKRVVDGLNMLESEMYFDTEEMKKNVLVKVRDLDKDILSVKKLVSEIAISFESALEKLGDVESKLEKSSEIVESQRMESAELARYIGAITNNLRREFVDYINLLEKKISEEIRKTAKVEIPELTDLSAKLSGLQNHIDKQVSESVKATQETRKTIDGLRQDIKRLCKALEDTLSSSLEKPDEISKTLLSLGKAVETIKGFVENQVEEAKESKSDSSASSPSKDSSRSEKETDNPQQ